MLPPAQQGSTTEIISAKMKLITLALVSLSLTCSALAAPVLTQDFGHFHLDVAAAKVHRLISSHQWPCHLQYLQPLYST